MTPKGERLLGQALKLGDEDRATMAEALARSLRGFESTEIEEAWVQESAKRAAAVDSGEEATVPWEEVRDRLNAKIRQAGS